VPFFDHDAAQIGEACRAVFAAEQQRERLWRGDQCSWQSFALTGASRLACVARTRLDGPWKAKRFDRFALRLLRVGCECAQWRDP